VSADDRRNEKARVTGYVSYLGFAFWLPDLSPKRRIVSYGWHHRVEHYPRLRVRDLLLPHGRSSAAVFIGRWQVNAEEVAATIVTHKQFVDIHFGDVAGLLGNRVDIVCMPAGFGGVRQFFVCPSCGQRRGALYLHLGQFRCRVCAGLRYVSQTLDFKGRQHLAIQKLEAKLTEEGEKPKRMHRRTFERILAQLEQRD
jgi:hypothetical protein